jgi:ketosteroid isomerase-like protein
MRKMWIVVVLLLTAICTFGQTKKEAAKAAILRAEAAFQQMVIDSGLAVAFVHFADNNAAIKRDTLLLVGKREISRYMASSNISDVSLLWTPSFVDASDDGTLGYTYGEYTFTGEKVTGGRVSYRGIFHTVWKLQSDGEWRYVWD